ncbi:MAG TPA: glycosyl hydrolase [Coriobacteriia bacterium]
MKRIAALLASMVLILGTAVVPAQAAPLRMSSSAVVRLGTAAPSIAFKVSTSVPSRVRVVVYRGRTVVRSLAAARSGSAYVASWNLRNGRGQAVGAGPYVYRVTAAARGRVASRSGRVRVPTATEIAAAIPAAVIDASIAGVPTQDPSPAVAPLTQIVPAPVAPTPTPAQSRWLGFYQSESGTTFSAALLTAREAQVAKHPAVVNFYIADSSSFPLSRVQTIRDHGSVPMVTLEFWSTQTGGVSTITNGSKDAYLIAFADAAKAYGGEVWLRPFHEMNSNWYPWAGASAGNSAAQVVAAWNHVRQIFVSRGVTNVKFVWCVNNESVPNTAANSIQAYWPGDANVDLLAIDAYNFGTSASWSTWRSFGSAVGSSYAAVTALSAKPLFLAEVGCVEQGGNKAAWITDMFASLRTTYPRITGVTWFNVNDTTANTDWRIDSSAASLAAFNTAVGTAY